MTDPPPSETLKRLQSHVRGYFQRKRFAIIKYNLYRIRMVIRLQCKWRNYYALHERIRIVKAKRLAKLRFKLAVLLQKTFRGLRDKRRVNGIRIDRGNEMLLAGRSRAAQEIMANKIQCLWKGHKGRRHAIALHTSRGKARERYALEVKTMRYLQRIGHGCIGRIRARFRRWEIANFQLRWNSARQVQRVYRGHLGRLRFDHFALLAQQEKEGFAAREIQRVYRGYRGKLLSAVARALRILRIKQHFYAVEIQRYMRGCVGRGHFTLFKEIETKRRVMSKAAREIQRIYRGHKGREAREIEDHLTRMEGAAKPLILHLKRKEEERMALTKVVNNMEFYEERMTNELFEIERELEVCMKTTNKTTDSSRINGMPQRFNTAYLRVRLKDHLEHEREIHRVKYIELQKRRAEKRDLDKDVEMSRRELIPLTTGLIAEVKRQRGFKLRQTVLARKEATIKIQALWRRALVRVAFRDVYKFDWEMRYDYDKSDKPYFINMATKEISWKKPLAYTFFCGRDASYNQYNKSRGGGYDTFGQSTKNFTNTDKIFGTSNVSMKLRHSITSAKILYQGGSGRNLTEHLVGTGFYLKGQYTENWDWLHGGYCCKTA
eukprot:gene26731-33355_t